MSSDGSTGDATATEGSPFQISETDFELLELAVITLAAVGYETTIEGTGKSQMLFAENGLSAIAVGASTTVEGLLEMEAVLSGQLIARIETRRIPDRRRDGYVVLLTAQPAESQQSEALFGMTYNLRHVRRVVRASVEPTTAGVARALRPVLPLLSRPNTQLILDPLDSLKRRLIEDGLDPQIVARAIALFRSGAHRGTPDVSEDDDYDE